MKGHILSYSIQSNTGDISGTDGNRYSFDNTEWKEVVIPSRGMEVDFDIKDSKAMSVYVALRQNAAAQPPVFAQGMSTHSATPTVDPPVGYSPKSKILAGLLGIFFGGLGVHNFYLGYIGKAVAQLLISVLSIGILYFASGIWGLVEGIMILSGKIDRDAKGVALIN